VIVVFKHPTTGAIAAGALFVSPTETSVSAPAPREENAWLAAVINASDDAILSATLDGQIMSWNPRAERLYRYSAQEAIGQNVKMLVRPGEVDSLQKLIESISEGRSIERFEADRVDKHGRRFPASLTLSAIRDAAGDIKGLASIAHDAGEQAAAVALRETAERLQLSQDAAGFGSFDWRVPDGTVLWSPVLERLYGLVPGEFADTYEHWARSVLAEDLDRTEASVQQAIGERSDWHAEFRILRPDGEVRWMSGVARPMFDEAGGCVRFMGINMDITDRKRAEEELRRSEERLRTIFEAAPIGVALADARVPWTLLQANSALGEMLGVQPGQLIGRGALTLIDESQRAAAQGQLQPLLDGEDDRVAVELQIRAAGLDPLWVNVSGAVITGADGRPEHLVLQLQDITDRKRFEGELRVYAERDPLTGLLNRRRLAEELARAIAENDRYGTPAMLLVCDLDNLKLVNDTLGHTAGDELIKGVARAFGERVRETDVLARMGGDEFAVLLPHTGLEQALAMAERLRAAVLELDLVAGGQKLHTTVSVGIAPVGDGLTAGGSLVAGDLAMYEAKRRGRNRIATSRQVFADDAMTNHLGWLERLRGALAEDRFELHAQPIIDLRSGEVSCLELLVRLRDEDGGLLMPAAFIPTAERFGVIADIDRWVVREGIRILAADQHSDTTYTINLSGASVGDPELLSLIEREITSTRVDPGRLIFEFTETAAIKELTVSREFTHGLARIGCASALDDFGSGFGSFSYLKHLPVQYVKIDGEFVRNLPGSIDDRVLLKAIVDVAHALRKQTIAEFVGSEQALTLLREYGVDYAQGVHLGMPQPLTPVG
jgi:diguanylate cyclase (GGDEF)-like protein/PAS domain S-box-containing protein